MKFEYNYVLGENDMTDKLEGYPKKATLKSGKDIDLRPMIKEDEKALHEFLKRLRPMEKLFLRHNVDDPNVVKQWSENINFDKVIPILAVDEDRIIGNGALRRNFDIWSPHVGDIRIVTDIDYRKMGLGRILAQELFLLAIKLRLEKVTASIIEDQTVAIAVFKSLGFEQEAVFKGHVVDLSGKKHNLIIMSHDISAAWKKMEDAYEDDMPDRSGHWL